MAINEQFALDQRYILDLLRGWAENTDGEESAAFSLAVREIERLNRVVEIGDRALTLAATRGPLL